jgi:hypothetical protein
LVLLSEPAPGQAPPGLTYMRLEHAPARQVGQWLAMLYVPAGASGTESRFSLLYPTIREVNAAAGWIATLDKAYRESERQDAFAEAIQRADALDASGDEVRERYRQSAAGFASVLDGDGQAARRWAAGVLAGVLFAEKLYDYEAAEQRLRGAAAIAPPGSLEYMTTYYHLARALIQDGRPGDADTLLSTIVAHFGAFRDTEVFERSRRSLAELSSAR